MKSIAIAAGLAAIALPNLAAAQEPRPCGKDLLAVVEPDGSVSAGSKAKVLAAARDGAPLRVGWDLARPGQPPILRHWQEALFVTVFENEVFAQVGGLHRQQPEFGKAHIALSAQTEMWHSSIGTNGRLLTKMSGGEPMWDQKVRAFWCRSAR